MENLEVQYINKNLVKPFKNNPRLHSEKQIQQIANSIKEFGFRVPISIDENMVILAGHGRYRAAEYLGFTEIPVVQHNDLTDVQKKAFIIADNKITQNSEWNYETLWDQVKQLNDMDFDLDILGFTEAEILPMIDDYTVHDLSSEWENMPEYSQENKMPHESILVHFENSEDKQKFASLINQNLTDKTKSIWYPEQEKQNTKEKIYD